MPGLRGDPSSLRLRLRGVSGKYTWLMLCTSRGAFGGCEAWMTYQPQREQARGNKFSIKGSSRAGDSKMSPTLGTRGYQKVLRTTQCTTAGRRVWTRTPWDQQRESHRLEHVHSTLPEPGPGYKGLATRVLIHNASVNTFIFLELHQGLEAEKTVAPNQNLAQGPRL